MIILSASLMVNLYSIVIFMVILIIIWLLFSYESFSYFNLNLDLNDPISHNNYKDQHYQISQMNYSQNYIDDNFNKNNTNDNNINIFDNRIKLNTTAKYTYDKPPISNLMESNNCCLVKCITTIINYHIFGST